MKTNLELARMSGAVLQPSLTDRCNVWFTAEQLGTFATKIIEQDRTQRQATQLQWGQPSGCNLPTPAAFGPVVHCQRDQPFFSAQQMRDYVEADRAQRQDVPLPDPQTLKQAHEAWRLTLPRQSAMDSESAAFVAGFKAQRPAEPYDQTALELCSVCGWKTLIPGEGCLNCERDQRQAGPDLTIAYMSGVADGKTQLQVGQVPAGYERIEEDGAATFDPLYLRGKQIPGPGLNGASYRPVYTAPPPAQVPEGITLDFKQASELLEMFGGEPTEITLIVGEGHSGRGVYAHYTGMPEEGAEFLGASDDEAVPAAPSNII